MDIRDMSKEGIKRHLGGILEGHRMKLEKGIKILEDNAGEVAKEDAEESVKQTLYFLVNGEDSAEMMKHSNYPVEVMGEAFEMMPCHVIHCILFGISEGI